MSGIVLTLTLFFSVLLALGMGTAVGYFLFARIRSRRIENAQSESTRILSSAEQEKVVLLSEAKEEARKTTVAVEMEIRDRRNQQQRLEGESKERRDEIVHQERRVNQREESLERRTEVLESRETGLLTREQLLETSREEVEQFLETSRKEVEQLKDQQLRQLESVAGRTLQEARQDLLEKAENEYQHELARKYWELEQQFKDEADQTARKVIALAIQRLAADVVTESTIKVVPLPNDEMKGRLIGREGRNIRAIEQATGVDLIIDDTPEAVTISCFDPVRREMARRALQELVLDGRIHPARIEETVRKAQLEVDLTIKQAGEEAVFDSGVRGLSPDMIKLLGRLKYRTSYGGNVLQHSVEVARIAGMLAAETGLDIGVCKAAGLLHDIGKALTHEVEGSHAEIGGEMAAKYGIADPVRRAIEEHHDEDKGSPEAFIVVAADAIAAARPGARSDSLERYTQRLEALEGVAKSFPGVERCFAIQAGREIRIMVQPEEVDDIAAPKLARDITKKIESTLTYPGQIKVMVIRETRAVEIAR